VNGLDAEALTVAMALVPGAYARNRHFGLYSDARVRHARARASLLRGLVRQLGGAEGPLEELTIDRGSAHVRMRYRLAHLRFERTADLTEVEAACVFHLAARANLPGFAPSPEDRGRLLSALRRLAQAGHGAEEALSSLGSGRSPDRPGAA